MSDAPALELSRITKRYPGTLALDGVDMDVRAGEVHALLGENGAGKSTLVKLIAGSFSDYAGQVKLSGHEVRLDTPAAARSLGIQLIHQELSLASPLSLAENILAGRLPTRWGLVDRKTMRAEARKCLDHAGLNIDPDTPVQALSPHEAQLVEIAKALGNDPKILVMDEPTSSLSREEVGRLFRLVRDLRSRGLAIVYISHHLPEVLDIADRATVLRDGRKVATCGIADTTAADLASMMVGRSVSDLYPRRSGVAGAIRLEVRNLTRVGFFHDVSLSVRAGEIVGIGGLSGAGRTELARSLCGIDPIDNGEVLLDGDDVAGCPFQQLARMGVAYLTEDRKNDGLALRLSINDNVQAASISRRARLGWYSPTGGMSVVRCLMERLQISPPMPSLPAGNLSGGNQQKVLLAKWLANRPRILIVDEPTRGVDVGAKVVIHRAIADAADQGAAVILISSDLPELVGLSDRVVILRQGRLIGKLAAADRTEDAVLLAANGQRELEPA
jgi:ribose transport system ATP-binding protein